MILLIAFATFVSTMVGGLFALRFKDKLHLVLGFSAGAVIGVAFFDLLPEALELGSQFFDAGTIATWVALGFVLYLVLDRTISIFFSCDDDHTGHSHGSSSRGLLGAGSLAVHSFLDGVAIGLAFQVSVAIGAVVTIAVLAHDFSDGINTVNMILKNKGEKKLAFRWLIVDALAPVLGATSTLFFTLPESALAVILSVFCGFFLYIGASDLIPESHHGHPKFLTTAMTLLGMGVLYVAIKFAGV
ncbi:MAG: ZIP family metal transporter [Patescibacteria group bacterium]